MIKIANKQNTKQQTRVNEQIKGYSECRVIDEDGSQLGVISLEQALKTAYDKDLDLVEVAAESVPPVCRIMDYSKYKYEQQKRDKANRKKSKRVDPKEIKFGVNIDKGDYQTKINHIRKFLEKGQNVQISIYFRGREISRPEMGVDILERAYADVEDIAVIAQQPKTEGRKMSMVLFPSSKKKK